MRQKYLHYKGKNNIKWEYYVLGSNFKNKVIGVYDGRTPFTWYDQNLTLLCNSMDFVEKLDVATVEEEMLMLFL